MKLTSFLRGKLPFIALSLFVSIFCALLLYTANANLYFAFFIPCFLFGGGLLALLPEYFAKNRYYGELNDSMRQLDRKFLLSEIA
jgi:hypothetical protein